VPDWQKLVRERLGKLDLPPWQKDDVAAELASHLEEVYEQQRALGRPELQAVERARSEVCDWNRLNRRIERAKRREGVMNDRIRHLWLPGLASFAAAVICEFLLARWSYQPVMLLRPHLTQPRSLWIVAQVLCGALGAYLSRRAGGTRSTRLCAALFTSVVLLDAIVIRICLATGWNLGFLALATFIKTIRIFIVIPTAAMLVGALPFLIEKKEVETA